MFGLIVQVNGTRTDTRALEGRNSRYQFPDTPLVVRDSVRAQGAGRVAKAIAAWGNMYPALSGLGVIFAI